MPSNAYIVCKIRVESNGQVFSLGTDDVPVTLAGSSGSDMSTYPIAAGATVTLWDAATGPVSTFSFLAIVSDQPNVMLELWGTTVASNHHVNLTNGVPFILGADDTQAYNAAGNFAGAAQVFTKILAKNNAVVTANVTRLIQA